MKIASTAVASITLATFLTLGISAVVAATPDLDAGIWTIAGSDTAGTNWSGSTITFASQVVQGADFQVAGYFNWTGSDGSFGRENFSGTLFANSHISLLGYELVPPTVGIATDFTYDADLTADGRRMVNGTWDAIGGIPSNAWTATQAIPEPSQLALLLAGLGALGLRARIYARA
jgi:PEP-CTERM motif